MDAAFWRGRRVLITGHTGFKGGWLSLWLARLGAQVYGYALPPSTNPSLYALAKVADAVESTFGDVRDAQTLTALVRRVQPEVVFHMAAQALVRASYADPAGTYATNVMGTVNLLEAVRQVGGVRAVVVVTSDKCYENREWLWAYREGEPLGGVDPYSSSKACAELVAQSWRQSFFAPQRYAEHGTVLASARAGNVIGGGDWASDRLIPDIVRAASVGQSVFIRNPLATRPWQHVLEPLSGYLTLGWRLLEGKAEFADGWNFGPSGDSNLTVDEVVKLSKKYWDKVEIEYSNNPMDAHEANLLMLDCSKANKLMHWKPVWGIDDTISRTIGWYKEYYVMNKVNSTVDLADYVRQAADKHIVWAQ